MRGLLLVCFSLFLPVALIWAQAENQQRFNVSGTVVNSVNNEPVRGALVELFGSERKSALTGPDGHFEIDGVNAGSTMITARRPGFEQQNQRPQSIKVDATADAITLKLTPLSRISGRIIDSDGESIEGVFIQSFAEEVVAGRKQWQPHNGSNTDENGNFVVENLKPGTYVLGTQEKQLYFVQPKSEAARYVYPPTFYPDSPSRDLAQHIELSPGEEMKVDMILRSIRGARISLTVVPPLANVMATIGQGRDWQGGNNAQVGKSGELIFSGIAPGSWKIVAQGPFGPRQGQSNEERIYGELQVEVGSTDMDNLKLPMGKLAEIPIMVSGAQNVQVYLEKAGRTVMGSNQDPNGEIKLSYVPPGTYGVVVPFNGSNTCVTSIMSGSQDLLRDELVVSTGANVPPIQIVAGSNCAQLTLNTSTKEASWVLITSDNRGFQPRMLPGVTNGYLANGLSDGDYKVYAFDEASELEYSNPDALRAFKNQTVRLDAGQKATVQLEVNERHPK